MLEPIILHGSLDRRGLLHRLADALGGCDEALLIAPFADLSTLHALVDATPGRSSIDLLLAAPACSVPTYEAVRWLVAERSDRWTIRFMSGLHAKCALFRTRGEISGLVSSCNLTRASFGGTDSAGSVEAGIWLGPPHARLEDFWAAWRARWADATAASDYFADHPDPPPATVEPISASEPEPELTRHDPPRAGAGRRGSDRSTASNRAVRVPPLVHGTDEGGDPLADRLEPLDFQLELIEKIKNWAIADHTGDRYDPQGRILQVPTGAGKTLIAIEVVRAFLARRPGARVLWLCHRREVLRQAFKRAVAQLGPTVPLFFYDPRRLDDPSVPVHRLEARPQDALLAFTTDQSYEARPYGTDWDLVVVDECHRYHGAVEGYMRVDAALHRRQRAARLGLTATPLEGDQADRTYFEDYWDVDRVWGRELTIAGLQERGVLSRVDPGSTHVATGFAFTFARGEKPTERNLLERIQELDHPRVNDVVAREVRALESEGECKRLLVFAVTIEHAERLATMIGRSARPLHSRLPWPEIREALSWFRERPEEAPGLRVLTSVLMAAEGVDLPLTDAIFFVRPTASPVLHRQMQGRGLRGPNVNGTRTCRFVDFTYQFLGAGGRALADFQAFHDRETAGEED